MQRGQAGQGQAPARTIGRRGGLGLGWASGALLLAASLRAGFVEEWAAMKAIVPRGYVCFRATNVIRLDGRLTEPTWQAAPWTMDFVDVEDGRQPAPPLRTRAKLLWDATNLYVAAELEQPHLRAAVGTPNADLGGDDCFVLLLDPDGDGHACLEIAVNALRTVAARFHDKPAKDGGRPVVWEGLAAVPCGVQVTGTLNDPADLDTGWTMELALPWTALAGHAGRRVPPLDGDQWRINLCRVEWPTAKAGRQYRRLDSASPARWVWSAHGVADLLRPERWGYVQFSRKRGTRARFIPDPAGPARAALQEVYYHQKDFHHNHGRWASSLAELGLAFRPSKELEQAPVIRLTSEGFEATVDGPTLGLKPLRWHLRQDGRFWADPELQNQLDRYFQTVPDTTVEP